MDFWKKVKQFFVFLFALVKKAVVWSEDAITDAKGKLDVRVILGIVGSLVVFYLALQVPSIIVKGAAFDLIAYGVVISLLIGFVLALFGISKDALDPKNDTSPVGSIVQEIKAAVASVK
jgi:hypothetical protein